MSFIKWPCIIIPAKRLAALAIKETRNAFDIFLSRKIVKPAASVITTAISRKSKGIFVVKYKTVSSGQVKRLSKTSINNASFQLLLYANSTTGNSISSVYKR